MPSRSTGRLEPEKWVWLSRLLAAALPFFVLFLIEIALRVVPGLNTDRDPYVNISPMAAFSRTTDASGTEYYNVTHPSILNAEAVHILVKKPADTIRIFCLGSSACASWPHPVTETWSAYLQQALQTAYPDKHIEVLNVAAHGFASYRTRCVLDAVLTMQPDAVFVWEGNNEFLEKREYADPNTVIPFLARHLRTAQWLQSALLSRNKMSGRDLKGVSEFFWKRIHQESLHLRSDPVQFGQVQEHFRASFAHMVSQSQHYGVPIVLCTVPVNLRDWLPTVSVNRLTGEALARWQQHYNQARRDLIQRNYRDGIQEMKQAIAMENEHAESYFWLGRLLEADGQRDAAWDAFNMARDEDYNPFRALSSFNHYIRVLAEANQHRGVYLLDLEQIFAGASQYAAPGLDLFLDYVHPTKPANLMVAREAFALIRREGVLKARPSVDQFEYHELAGKDGKPYSDATDDHLQATEMNMALESHQYEVVIAEIEAFVELRSGHHLTGPDDPLWASISPELAERYRPVWTYLDAQRRIIMNQPGGATELDYAKHTLDDHYAKWFRPGAN